MSFKTPMSRVSGLGSAKDGTGHWWAQRITAIALVPLTLLFLFPFAGALGGEHEAVSAVYASPFNAIIAVLFIATAFRHLQLGLQVVIEDYVHAPAWRTGLLLGSTHFCAFFGLAGVFAVARLAFST